MYKWNKFSGTFFLFTRIQIKDSNYLCGHAASNVGEGNEAGQPTVLPGHVKEKHRA